MTPLERAARALVGDHPARPWESLSPDAQARWMGAARAVLQAIREPDVVMIDEAYASYDANGGSLRDVFMDMIDAALGETE